MPTPRRDARLARRKHQFVERMAAAKSPAERLAAAVDYFRAMLRDATTPDQVNAATTATSAVIDCIVTHADHLAEEMTS